MESAIENSTSLPSGIFPDRGICIATLFGYQRWGDSASDSAFMMEQKTKILLKNLQIFYEPDEFHFFQS